MKQVLLLVAALVLPAAAASAQDVPDAPSPRFFDYKTTTELSSYAVLTALDAYTSVDLQSHGFHEANPLARPFVSSRAGATLYFAGSAGMVLGEVWLARHFEQTRPDHRRLWHGIKTGILVGNMAVESLAAGHNFYWMRRLPLR